jgi:hypothetical protein
MVGAHRDISAPIMIRCSKRTGGRRLRILEIAESKTVPYVPLSHPFVERLIGTMRREFLDQVLFWNARDLERTLADFQAYYNAARGHASLAVSAHSTGGPWSSSPHALRIRDKAGPAAAANLARHFAHGRRPSQTSALVVSGCGGQAFPCLRNDTEIFYGRACRFEPLSCDE